MRRGGSGIPTILLLVLILAGFTGMLFLNASPSAPQVAVLPTQAVPTEPPDALPAILRGEFGDNSTPLATIAIPTQPFIVPTVTQQAVESPTAIEAADLVIETQSSAANFATPTLPPATPTLVGVGEAALVEATSEVAVIDAVTTEPDVWQPPPLIPPLSRDPLGRDHFWLMRPVDSNANNAVLFYYPYGSDGPEQANPLRVHHGIDMPNPIGETVRAAGSGRIIWAADGRENDAAFFQDSPSYGNVVVIEHDFGYRGQPIYTLYAHLSAALVRSGETVEAGQVIGLVGNSGRVSGPHVHFEIRVGENAYRATYNPVLWMVPYVGHGVIAGRIVDENGNWLNDIEITVRNRSTGLVQDTVTSYVLQDTAYDVNGDPIWRENYAIADVPVGRYDVIATINGERVVQQITVIEGTTGFVELKPSEPATIVPVTLTPEETSESESGG